MSPSSGAESDVIVNLTTLDVIRSSKVKNVSEAYIPHCLWACGFVTLYSEGYKQSCF